MSENQANFVGVTNFFHFLEVYIKRLSRTKCVPLYLVSTLLCTKVGAVPKRFLGNQSKLDTLLKQKYKMATMRKSIKDIKGLALNGLGGTAVSY